MLQLHTILYTIYTSGACGGLEHGCFVVLNTIFQPIFGCILHTGQAEKLFDCGGQKRNFWFATPMFYQLKYIGQICWSV